MAGTTTITVDHARRLLTFVAEGFFEPTDVTRVAAEKLDALRQLGGDLHDHVSLVDVTACKIQKQDIANAFASLIGDKRFMARRVAFVTGQASLARMQVRRMSSGVDVVRMFLSRVEAEAWLLDQERAAA